MYFTSFYLYIIYSIIFIFSKHNYHNNTRTTTNIICINIYIIHHTHTLHAQCMPSLLLLLLLFSSFFILPHTRILFFFFLFWPLCPLSHYYYYYTLLEITNTLKSYNLFLPNIFQSLKPHIIIYLFTHLIFEISLLRFIHLRNFEFPYFHQWNKLYS